MKSLLRIAALLGLALVLGAGSDEFSSLAAKSAKRKYDSALAAAQAEYDKQAGKARETYLAELNAAFKSALRNQQLDEANRLKAQIDVLTADGATSRFAGTWAITWLHGGPTADYTFNGNVIEVTGPVRYTGRVQSVIGNEAVAYFEQTGDLHRYTLVHGKLVVESFSKANVATGKPDGFGLGELVKAKGS